MIRFRGVRVWALVCLAVGLGCADTASDAKPDKEVSAETQESNVEQVLTDQLLADEPGSKVIPLDTIWANRIPETQSIRLLEYDYFESTARKNPGQGSSLYRQIVVALVDQFDENQPTGPGFAVAGTGYEALATAKEIIVEQEKIPSQTFSAGTEITLFFERKGLV